jgi:hypothetical protein
LKELSVSVSGRVLSTGKKPSGVGIRETVVVVAVLVVTVVVVAVDVGASEVTTAPSVDVTMIVVSNFD